MALGYQGPALFSPIDDLQAQVHADAGLPEVFYSTDGYFEESFCFASTAPEDSTLASATIVEDLPTGVRDVCDLLDEADEDGQVDGID